MYNQLCPLCASETVFEFHEDRDGRFLRCETCHLIYKSDGDLLDLDTEKKRYELHNNDVNDPGYIHFLNKLVDPISKWVQPHHIGLDFGCGPSISIEKIFEEKDIKCDSFDPFFFPNDEFLVQESYDFLTCSEVIEHIVHSKQDLQRMISLVKVGGVLGIMTESPPEKKEFQNWWYKKDPTHIRFFSDQTFQTIAQMFSLEILYRGKSVVVYRRIHGR